ncbi:hypothetical protein [Clostridium oryzae]|uniref:Uncharacterized protein n=1 Tax=Clostridium oryzae TaxID=1450648 RepID=A0A1V4I5U9_9CLOT|nr:hypothetical protein [Clostridium oryzae]OPJ55358.1 hypothetical protein CLORY_44240 [Clostridium oryzae]
MKKIITNTSLFILTFLLIFNFSIIPAKAAPYHSVTITIKKGGSWTYNHKDDEKITKHWTSNQYVKYEHFYKIAYIKFIPPKAVQALANKTLMACGKDKKKAIISFMVQKSLSFGKAKAKKMAIAKFGASIVSKFIPYLNAVSWGYTAITLFQSVEEGYNEIFYSTAAKKKTGVIIEHRTSGKINNYYWNGSTKYGKYPYAHLGSNNWQYGKVKVYR